MKLRERLRLLFKSFESALTRVEDQGVRIENGIEKIERIVAQLNDAVGTLHYDVAERHNRSEREITDMKNRLSVVERVLGNKSARPPN